MHGDIKVVQQLLTEERHPASDLLTNEGSSFLGKYIIGAKNNFVGFNSKPDENASSFKVPVHNGEKEGVTDQIETDNNPNVVGDCEAEGSKPVTDCDVVKMEEGRAKTEVGDQKEEQMQADNRENTEHEVKVVAGTSLNHVEKESKPKAGKGKEDEKLTGGKVSETHTDTTPDTVNSEKTETKSPMNKFKESELKEQKVEPKWKQGKKFEHEATGKIAVKEGNAKPGATTTVPSPTGSSLSQDTGFGSEEGDGAIGGTVVRP